MTEIKIMMIDPWGINNISLYINGLCSGISKYVDLTLITNYYYKTTTDAKYNIMPIFFRVSEKMSSGKLRKIIRGIEYIYSYKKIIKELKKNRYDIVHIQWLLQYKTDIHFLKRIKRYCKKIVYTAHNVVPHTNSDRYIDNLRTIYGLVDDIILHGEGVREEFESLFGEFKNKVIIQGMARMSQSTQYNTYSIKHEIIDKVEKYERVFLFFGNIFYNKGVDRLAKIWLENFNNSDQFLIIAGRKNTEFKELDVLEADINKCNNILYINKYIEDNLLNYLINKSDIILLPYRHASMSGVVFTAAEFKKTVLCTDVGSLVEYITNNEDGFVVESTDELLCEKMKYISSEVTKEELADMGKKLNRNITDKFSWDRIGEKLLTECYEI
ncbi:MAG: glycosyltransferase family 4 protein [Desulfitobacteriaceae bacterium]